MSIVAPALYPVTANSKEHLSLPPKSEKNLPLSSELYLYHVLTPESVAVARGMWLDVGHVLYLELWITCGEML